MITGVIDSFDGIIDRVHGFDGIIDRLQALLMGLLIGLMGL